MRIQFTTPAQLRHILSGHSEGVTLRDDSGNEYPLSDVQDLGDNESIIGAWLGMDYPHPKMVEAIVPDGYRIENAADMNGLATVNGILQANQD